MSAAYNDFEALVRLIRRKHWLPKSLPSDFPQQLKQAHTSIYSILIWDSKIGKLPARSRYFIREIRSDAVSSLSLALTGYNKAASHALRSMIENAIRLVYYKDNSAEYSKLATSVDGKGKLTFESLFDYTQDHPIMGDHVKTLKIIDRLRTLYSETSRYVHASTLKFMTLAKVIRSIRINPVYFNTYVRQLKIICSEINALLCLIYHQRFRNFESASREKIRKAMGKTHYTYIMKCEPIE